MIKELMMWWQEYICLRIVYVSLWWVMCMIYDIGYSCVCVCCGSSVASLHVFIGPTEMNSAGTACVTTFHSPRQSFYSIVLLSPDFLSPGYTAKKGQFKNRILIWINQIFLTVSSRQTLLPLRYWSMPVQ